MNAFDLVVTVALGSILATVLLSADVTLAEGAAALILLVLAQFAVAWSAARSARLRWLIKPKPTLLAWDGQLIADKLRSERVTDGEIRQAIRSTGHGDISDVGAVVLENDGSLSVIAVADLGDSTALADVANIPKSADG